jgi:hypothetical protein
VIEVTATNFALLSAEEQDSKIYSYAALLNSLSFPVQILIRSKKLDITSYLKLLDAEANKTQNQMLAEQIRLYKDFIQELIKVNTVLDKKFYISVPFSYLEKGIGAAAAGASKKGAVVDSAFVQNARASLRSKAESLHSQLGSLIKILDSFGTKGNIKTILEKSFNTLCEFFLNRQCIIQRSLHLRIN